MKNECVPQEFVAKNNLDLSVITKSFFWIYTVPLYHELSVIFERSTGAVIRNIVDMF